MTLKQFELQANKEVTNFALNVLSLDQLEQQHLITTKTATFYIWIILSMLVPILSLTWHLCTPIGFVLQVHTGYKILHIRSLSLLPLLHFNARICYQKFLSACLFFSPLNLAVVVVVVVVVPMYFPPSTLFTSLLLPRLPNVEPEIFLSSRLSVCLWGSPPYTYMCSFSVAVGVQVL